MPTFYLTTAIDYANAAPHIGHAYEKIAADIVARYYRMDGRQVFFLTGLDEHGSKVDRAAGAAGKSPQQFVDEIAEQFQCAWRKLNLSYDRFIRTTEKEHESVVQEMFRLMRDRGDVYKGKYSGLYCEGCEDYLRERDLIDGNCPNHKRPPRIMEEENYFFRLTNYKEKLRNWLTGSAVVMPEFRRTEVLNQLDDEDFGDFSISRSRQSLTWGIPVPDDEEQVIYVWIDALTNYITGVGAFHNNELWERFWPCDLHLIGKDIVKFHAIYWPAMLMAAGIELPRLIFGHGFITVEGQKMSKTVGNVMDPNFLVEQYGADAVRYFLFQNNTFELDGDFSTHQFIQTVNSHLANNLGNLLNRTLSQVERHCDGKVPAAQMDQRCIATADGAAVEYRENMRRLDFKRAIEAAFVPVNEANRFLNERKPWTMFKEGQAGEASGVLLTALELIKRAAVMLCPVTPQLSQRIWHQLGYDGELPRLTFTDERLSGPIPPGQPIRNEGPVFQRLEAATSLAEA